MPFRWNSFREVTADQVVLDRTSRDIRLSRLLANTLGLAPGNQLALDRIALDRTNLDVVLERYAEALLRAQGIVRSVTMVVAAADSSDEARAMASYSRVLGRYLVCDSIDDHEEILAAIIEAEGGSVLLKKGHYYTWESIFPVDRTLLCGEGYDTWIIPQGGCQGIYLTDVADVVVQDLSIDGLNINYPLLVGNGASGVIVQRVQAYRANDDGIAVSGTARNISLLFCKAHHVQSAAPGTRAGIEIDDGPDNVLVMGCECYENGSGINIHNHPGELGPANIWLVFNRLHHNNYAAPATPGRQIAAYNDNGATLPSNLWIMYNNLADGQYGIEIGQCRNAWIKYNSIRNMSQLFGIRASNAPGFGAGNIFIEENIVDTVSAGYCIQVTTPFDRTARVTVKGNSCSGGALGSYSLPAGVERDYEVTRLAVRDEANRCRLPTNGPWTFSGAGSGDGLPWPGFLRVQTGAVANSRGLYWTELHGLAGAAGATYELDLSKRLSFQFLISRFVPNAEIVARLQIKGITTEGALAAVGLGIQIDDMAVKGESYGTALGLIDLATALVDDRVAAMSIELYPGEAVEWWLEGVRVGVQDDPTKVPGGLLAAKIVYSIVNGPVGGVDCYSEVIQPQIEQKRRNAPL